MGFCSEDRKSEGIFAELTVRENIILALQAQEGHLPLHPDEEAAGDRRRADQVPGHQDARAPNNRGRPAQRRQPAEGDAGALAGHQPDHPHPRRAHARHRRRRQAGDHGADPEPEPAGHGRHLHLLGVRGGGPLQHPDRRAEGQGEDRRAERRADRARAASCTPSRGGGSHGDLESASSRSKIVWPLVALGILLLFNLFFTPHFFRIEMQGRAPVRQPDRHPEERRPDHAAGHRADPGHRDARASTSPSARSWRSPRASWPC